MQRPPTLFVVVCLLVATARGEPLLPPPGPDAATIRSDSPQTRKRLAEIEQQILAGKTADAADELQRVLDESGDDLIAVDAHHYAPARQYVHRFLAQLPPARLNSYRDRIEEPARRLLDEGRRYRDPTPLRRLLARYFVSRPAEEAIVLLGELAFERGEFRTAESYWRRLTAESEEFPYPAPQTDAAAIHAKITLAVVFQGEIERANVLHAELREKYPDAAGRLAGRTGKYTEILADLIAHPPRLPPELRDTATWTTFAGTVERSGRVNGRLPHRWPNRPTWVTPIPRDAAADRDRYPPKPPPVGAARSVAFHPVVIGNHAYLADAGRIFAFDLATGKVRTIYDIRRENPLSLPAGDLKLPLRYDADFTLSASGSALFTRLGPARVAPDPAQKQLSYLVCLDVDADTAKPRWVKTPPVPNPTTAAWEGAPLVVDGRVLAAFVHADGGRIVHAMACYDASGQRLLWTAELTEGVGPQNEMRHRQELLTQAGPNVVFCSHTGAVIAIDIYSGKPAWAFRYPTSRRMPGESRYRDLNPPVAADGRVFVAPTDSQYLLALDAASGRLLWQSGPLEIEQIIGLADGKLICTIAAPVRGVRGFDVATGSIDPPHGWVQHDDPGLSSFGRGLVSEELVVWPTQAGIFALRIQDGLPARQPILGPHGNLAFANGVLLCATPTELWGYLSPSPTLPQPKDSGGGHRVARMGDRSLRTSEEWLISATASLTTQTLPPASTMINRHPTVRIPVTVKAIPAPLQPAPKEPSQPVDSPGLSKIIQTPSRTIARLGESHLLALDRASSRIAWVLDALKRPQFNPYAVWPTRRFLAPLYADDTHVIAFTADRRRLVINASDGTIQHDQPGPASEFVTTPIRMSNNHILTSTSPSSVTAFEPHTGLTVWHYDAGRPASLMGTAPVIWSAGDTIFVGITRNIGVELDQLRATDGAQLWRNGPAFLPTMSINPAATAWDDQRLYIPCASQLIALRLDTGQVAWQVALSDNDVATEWTVHSAKNVIFAMPTTAIPEEPLAMVVKQIAWSFARRPIIQRLPGLVKTLYDAWIERTVPILVFDPITGRQLQRVDLSACGPVLSAHLSTDGLAVQTGKTLYLLK